jgi:hypothetical protein
MMRRMQTSLRLARIAAPLVVAAFAVSSAACSGGCSRSDKAQEAGAQGGGDNTPAAVPTVPLPADFPKEVPVYPGARVTAAAKSAGPAGKPAWSVTATSDAPMANVVKYYKEHFGDIRLKQEIGEANTSTTIWGNSAYDVTIAATSAEGMTTLAISVVGK